MKKIRGLSPTLKQIKLMQQNGMDHTQWMVSKVFSDRVECIHRVTGSLKSAFYEARRI